MRIAIVDDVAAERENLQDRLETQLKHLSIHAEFTAFASGEAFLVAAKQQRFSLVFLDIYMDGINGVETAKKLRLFDKDCVLVFITSSADHALEGFRVRALQYLVKPYTNAELEALLNEVTTRPSITDPYLEVNTASGTVCLHLHEILYAQHFQHQMHIEITSGRKIITRQTFRAFAIDLQQDDRFFPCNRGIIINLEYVADFDGKAFILTNGKKVTVSRNLAKTAKRVFGEFLFKRGRI